VIEMRAADVEDLKRSQKLMLHRHSRGLAARARILRFLGRRTPEETGVNPHMPRCKDYVNATLLLLPQWLFGSPARRRLLEPLVSLLVAADEATRARKDRAAGRSEEWLKQFSEKGKSGGA